MDAIDTIIVTAFVNIIITGIVSNLIFYRHQKNIETSFAKQMEEFRVTLQYSMFEQQTKFTKSHEKRVEALETLYQKFKIFTDAVKRWVEEVGFSVAFEDEIKVKDYVQRHWSVQAKLDECLEYLEDSRLFLPHDLINEISDVFEEAGDALSIILLALDPNEMPSSSAEWQNIEDKMEKGAEKLYLQFLRLENAYKSVADTIGK